MLSGEIAVSSRPLGGNAPYSRRYTLESEIKCLLLLWDSVYPLLTFIRIFKGTFQFIYVALDHKTSQKGFFFKIEMYK